MKLDLSPFEKALQTLAKAIEALKASPDNDYIRDACIQRFEYCYDLSHKMLRRYLEITEPAFEQIAALEFTDLMRLGYGRGLVEQELRIWKDFRNARNITSYTYDENKANEVIRNIPAFLADAQFLLAQISKRQRQHE